MKNRLKTRNTTRSGSWFTYPKSNLLVYLTYAILLGIAVARHEPWFDEAQAWLLARDASLAELLVKYLRYEGSPGLWHLLLMIPAKLGLPYIALNIFSGMLAAVGAYLFLRYSPFPLVIKLLYPFSFFAFYQYGVVARSYSLLPVLLFSIAAVYKEKIQRPFRFCVLLILLANVSVHGLIIALSLAFLHMLKFFREWAGTSPAVRYKNFIAAGLLGITVFLIKLQLELPRDLISVAGFNKDFSSIFSKCMPILLNSLSAGHVAEGPVKYSLINGLPELLSIFAVVLSLFWFILRKRLLTFAVPTLALFALFTLVYFNEWHMGIMFFVWLFVMWLSYEDRAAADNEYDKITAITKTLVTCTIAVILTIQSFWTLNAFVYDFSGTYSASRAAAAYIKEHQLDRRKIYATNFHSISILPYFEENIFCNYNNKAKPSFWIWSRANSMYREQYLSTEKYDPDIILLGIKDYSPTFESIDKPFIPDIKGFRYVKLFPGALFWKDRPLETDSFILYEKQR